MFGMSLEYSTQDNHFEPLTVLHHLQVEDSIKAVDSAAVNKLAKISYL